MLSVRAPAQRNPASYGTAFAKGFRHRQPRRGSQPDDLTPLGLGVTGT